jgi:MFS family permease
MKMQNIKNDTSVYGILLSINAITVIVFQIPFGFIFKKIKLMVLSYIYIGLFALAFFILALANSVFFFIIAIFFISIAEVISSLLINVIIDNISTEDNKSIYFGIWNLSTLGLFIGPILGGMILKIYGGIILYNSIAIILLISIVMYHQLILGNNK